MVVAYSVHRESVKTMKEEDKKRAIVKYCLAYKKSNRVNKCVKIIGRVLHQCEGTQADALFAASLLNLLGSGD